MELDSTVYRHGPLFPRRRFEVLGQTCGWGSPVLLFLHLYFSVFFSYTLILPFLAFARLLPPGLVILPLPCNIGCPNTPRKKWARPLGDVSAMQMHIAGHKLRQINQSHNIWEREV